MGRALRGGRPQRGAHPRRFGMRQVARHPRLGAHRAQTARTGRSRDLRDRIRGALSRRCAHDLHHRFERQDRHQGVDRRRTARGDEILPLSEKLQFAAGRAPLGADARRRRGVSHLRGGHFEARRDGAAGAHHPSRRGCFYLDRRRAPGEFPQSRAEVRREDGAGPQCFENRLPQLL